MSDEQFDIYGDLDNFDLGERITTLENEVKDLKKQNYDKDQTIISLKAENKDLIEKNGQLLSNISSLLLTATLETSRKDKAIADLRQKSDDIIFRRKYTKKDESFEERSTIRNKTPVHEFNNKEHNNINHRKRRYSNDIEVNPKKIKTSNTEYEQDYPKHQVKSVVVQASSSYTDNYHQKSDSSKNKSNSSRYSNYSRSKNTEPQTIKSSDDKRKKTSESKVRSSDKHSTKKDKIDDFQKNETTSGEGRKRDQKTHTTKSTNGQSSKSCLSENLKEEIISTTNNVKNHNEKSNKLDPVEKQLITPLEHNHPESKVEDSISCNEKLFHDVCTKEVTKQDKLNDANNGDSVVKEISVDEKSYESNSSCKSDIKSDSNKADIILDNYKLKESKCFAGECGDEIKNADKEYNGIIQIDSNLNENEINYTNNPSFLKKNGSKSLSTENIISQLESESPNHSLIIQQKHNKINSDVTGCDVNELEAILKAVYDNENTQKILTNNDLPIQKELNDSTIDKNSSLQKINTNVTKYTFAVNDRNCYNIKLSRVKKRKSNK